MDRTYPGNQSESGLRTAVSESGARALAAGTANLSFRHGDGRDLPLPDASPGLAVLHTVPSHVPDPQVELAEAFRVLRPGGTLAAFDGDYNALSVATSDTDPLQACAVAFIQNFVHDRWIIRRLPAMVCAAGFTNATLRSHGYAQTASPAYLASIINRGASALAADGRIGPELAEALKAEARRRAGAHAFRTHRPCQPDRPQTRLTRPPVTQPKEDPWRRQDHHGADPGHPAHPRRGRARVAGHDVAAEPRLVRRAIALAGQAATVDEDLTGRENLVLLARLSGLGRAAAKARAARLLAAFELDEAAARQVKAYSGGMRRRLDLAASLLARAEVYFLDEPTAALASASRAQVHQVIRALAADGATVLLTTQYLDEADQLAARIAVIDHGTVIAEGTPGQLKAATGAGTLRIRLADPAQRPLPRRTLAGLLRAPVHEGPDPVLLTATVPAARSGRPPSEQAAAAVTGLGRAGVSVGEFALGQPSLDEVFLALTGQHAAGSTQAATGSQAAAGAPATTKGSS